MKKLSAGEGHVHVQYSIANERAILSDLGYSYPLKLMSPSIAATDGSLGAGLVCLYMLTYGEKSGRPFKAGGGLVSGDSIDLSIRLDPSCHLVLLTQGNTKVLRERPGGSYHSLRDDGLVGTYQKMVVDVEPYASVFLLPAPVTCFEKSIYSQHQIFNLSSSSSLLLLDWFTSGRHSRGESWAFERYRSQNEVHIDGKKLANDVLLLEGRDIHARMSKYSCYCTMVLCGPALASILNHFVNLSAELRQYKRTEPQDLIWSFSELMTQGGEGAVSAGIVRCAGIETEMVKEWVEKQLAGLKDIVGTDMYKAAFV